MHFFVRKLAYMEKKLYLCSDLMKNNACTRKNFQQDRSLHYDDNKTEISQRTDCRYGQ